MRDAEEVAREVADAIVKWGGCFDCCSDSGAAFDKISPDAEVRWADERIPEALLDLVRQVRAETLAEVKQVVELHGFDEPEP